MDLVKKGGKLMEFPRIIQGGMGVGVSGWRLASAVALSGGVGVVAGIGLDEVLIRKLQLGDIGGHVRRALEHFPLKEAAKRILDKFFHEGGKSPEKPFISVAMPTPEMSDDREDLFIAAGFTEIFLAKEGHNGLVGINIITKVQTDCLCTLYGCMLAGVDYVIMGAGIPRDIPEMLDTLSKNMAVKLKLNVFGADSSDDFHMTFDPARYGQLEFLKRPKFLAIISSNVLALTLLKKSVGKIDGFVVERHIAAGHNAPSRISDMLNDKGEPVYGPKDEVDLDKLKKLGLPFWLAGGYSVTGKLKEALDKGAVGIQSGTPFVLCEESEITDELKEKIFNSDKEIFTDPKASPTGFPFKVVKLEGTLSEASVYEARPRVCNLGHLRERYKRADGKIGYRCPAEPVKDYISKGGDEKDTVNCRCLCNALLANIGKAAVYTSGYVEKALITAGNILPDLDYNIIKPGVSAKRVMEYLMDGFVDNHADELSI